MILASFTLFSFFTGFGTASLLLLDHAAASFVACVLCFIMGWLCCLLDNHHSFFKQNHS